MKTVRRYVRVAEDAGVVRAAGKAALTDELVAAVVAALERSTARWRMGTMRRASGPDRAVAHAAPEADEGAEKVRKNEAGNGRGGRAR